MYNMWLNTKAEYLKTTHKEEIRTQKRNGIGRDKCPSSNMGRGKHSCSNFSRVRRWKGKQKDVELLQNRYSSDTMRNNGEVGWKQG